MGNSIIMVRGVVAAPAFRKADILIRHRWYAPVKRVVELIAALALSVVATPIVTVAAIVVKLSSRGPAFYTQTRVGRGGRNFEIFKLRTMVNNCEAISGPRWSAPGDPRITPVGRVLRASHIDELPQLLNVLLGHMSLIGPRPERPEFVPVLDKAVIGYRDRVLVRPGVTGFAQVQLPPDTDLASVQRKLAYDLYYIERQSPWLDFQVLLGTLFKVVGIPFRFIQKLLRLPTYEEIEQSRTPPPLQRQAS
jgi:lipopolysaccharide/colanic/teichoic acid biosynthesis glycosyltransferase